MASFEYSQPCANSPHHGVLAASRFNRNIDTQTYTNSKK
jgi:hypothetical protein